MRGNSIHFGLKLFGKIVTFKRITKFKQKRFFYTKYGITVSVCSINRIGQSKQYILRILKFYRFHI